MPEKEESEKLEERKMKAKAWKTGKEKAKAWNNAKTARLFKVQKFSDNGQQNNRKKGCCECNILFCYIP